MSNIVDKLNELSLKIKDFIITNGDNPLVWIVLFFGGVLIFWLTYSALHKDK